MQNIGHQHSALQDVRTMLSPLISFPFLFFPSHPSLLLVLLQTFALKNRDIDTSRQMSQHEHMLYPAPPPRRMSSQAALHVTSPTSEEYEFNVNSPTHRLAPAPPMPSHSSPKNAREVVSPITRVCSQCQHDGPPVWVADTSCVTCCCHVMCISLLVLFALLGQRSRGKIVHHTLVLVM